MTKYLFYGVLIAALVGVWMSFLSKNKEIELIEAQIQKIIVENPRDGEEEVIKLRSQQSNIEGMQTFNGILLAFLSAGVLGMLFVFHILPMVAHKFTHAVYDSGEMMETDPMHDARSLVAQGDYEGAIEAFKAASDADPLNRLPWVEIAKIQKENLDDTLGAVATLREALEGRAWQENDAAYFMFRLAELYDEDLENREVAIQILEQVCTDLPETRHAANARHKLHEWGLV